MELTPWAPDNDLSSIHMVLHMPKQICYWICGLSLIFASSLLAQAPEYRPPPPPSKQGRLELRARYLLAPDVAFSGLGSVNIDRSPEQPNNPFNDGSGSERNISYDDGRLSQDYEVIDRPEGGESRRIPENNEGTGNFVYLHEDQVRNDGKSLAFHNYRSESIEDASYAAETSDSMGWELNYTRFLSPQRKFGVQVGFAFSGFDSSFNDTINSNLYVEEFIHDMYGDDQVPEIPKDGDGEPQPPYRGSRERSEDGSDPILEWARDDNGEELIAEGASVRSAVELRSAVYSLRAGPTYQYEIGQRFAFNLGAGLSVIYYSGEFSAFETLLLPVDGTQNPTREKSMADAAEWQFGGYLDANAHFNMTERMSIFSGMQYQGGSNYTQSNSNRSVEVDFSSQIYVHAGMGIRF